MFRARALKRSRWSSTRVRRLALAEPPAACAWPGARATRPLLAVAKARGVKLGGPKLAVARQSATMSIRALADPHAANVLPIIREVQRAGATSLHQIDQALTRGISTPSGGR
jgi:hypothetical protein